MKELKPPIYEPKGAAKEYGDWALNIYTGCSHACSYCYCPKVLHKDPQEFFTKVEPRKNIVEEVRKQIEREHITGRLVHLCFVGDPYPTGYDSTPTRDIIRLLKDSGNHVQILTKGDGKRDFDLLDDADWYGVTIDGTGGRKDFLRILDLEAASIRGIKTWVSFEPVIQPMSVFASLRTVSEFIDKVKIGKLNYHPSSVNWSAFGREVEALCQSLGLDYYIKDSLRKEMEKGSANSND